MTQHPAPFSCIFTREFPDLLANLGCSLLLTTYQAGKVILLSPNDDDGLVQLLRTFAKPMGTAVQKDRLAVATRDAVVVLANATSLARDYPRQPHTYDALFMPRALYLTGELDLHDMGWGKGGLWAVNTRFSCLAIVDDRYSFTPRWTPRWITGLSPDDRCHLNGMALVDDLPRYVTALGTTDTPAGWRPGKLTGGVLLDVPSNEPILQGLPMPHSPRMYDGTLYALLSATGELIVVDHNQGTYEVVTRLPGFVRGMARQDDWLFVAASRLRKRHTFGDLPLARSEPFCGVVAVHLPTGRIGGSVQYLASTEEIYDVQVLPGLRRPGLLAPDSPGAMDGLHLPDTGYWAQPIPETPPHTAALTLAMD